MSPVYQHGQPLVAVETHRLGVGVGAHGAGLVGEEDLARHDVPRGDEQAAAALLVADPVGGGVGHPGHPRSVTGAPRRGSFHSLLRAEQWPPPAPSVDCLGVMSPAQLSSVDYLYRAGPRAWRPASPAVQVRVAAAAVWLTCTLIKNKGVLETYIVHFEMIDR